MDNKVFLQSQHDKIIKLLWNLQFAVQSRAVRTLSLTQLLKQSRNGIDTRGNRQGSKPFCG
jgi:hypothetical protein